MINGRLPKFHSYVPLKRQKPWETMAFDLINLQKVFSYTLPALASLQSVPVPVLHSLYRSYHTGYCFLEVPSRMFLLSPEVLLHKPESDTLLSADSAAL